MNKNVKLIVILAIFALNCVFVSTNAMLSRYWRQASTTSQIPRTAPTAQYRYGSTVPRESADIVQVVEKQPSSWEKFRGWLTGTAPTPKKQIVVREPMFEFVSSKGNVYGALHRNVGITEEKARRAVAVLAQKELEEKKRLDLIENENVIEKPIIGFGYYSGEQKLPEEVGVYYTTRATEKDVNDIVRNIEAIDQEKKMWEKRLEPFTRVNKISE